MDHSSILLLLLHQSHLGLITVEERYCRCSVFFLFPMYLDPPFPSTFCAPRFSTSKDEGLDCGRLYRSLGCPFGQREKGVELRSPRPHHVERHIQRGIIAELRDYVTIFRDTATDPSLVIIHVGINDIGYLQTRNLLAEIANVIYYIQGCERGRCGVTVVRHFAPGQMRLIFHSTNKTFLTGVWRAANKYARSVTRGICNPPSNNTSERGFVGTRDGNHHSYEFGRRSCPRCSRSLH